MRTQRRRSLFACFPGTAFVKKVINPLLEAFGKDCAVIITNWTCNLHAVTIFGNTLAILANVAIRDGGESEHTWRAPGGMAIQQYIAIIPWLGKFGNKFQPNAFLTRLATLIHTFV